jgi:hypothetical protein
VSFGFIGTYLELGTEKMVEHGLESKGPRARCPLTLREAHSPSYWYLDDKMLLSL